MKLKIILLAITLTSMLTVFTGCRKGEEDPFISLRTRKARVTGVWTIKKQNLEISLINSNSSGSYINNTEMGIDGEKVSINSTISESYEFSTSIGKGDIATKITFDKDGNFKRTIRFKNITNNTNHQGGSYYYSNYTSVSIENNTVVTTGTWNFLDENEEDYKNKERLIINIMEETNEGYSTTTVYQKNDTIFKSANNNSKNYYTNGDKSEIWHISKLKNKEMILDSEINRSSTSVSSQTNNPNGYSNNSAYSTSEKGTTTTTLVME